MDYPNELFAKGEFASELKMIEGIVDRVAELVKPERIILFSVKLGTTTITSFKLCVVKDTIDKQQTELDIFVNVSSTVPFDIVLYTTAEWRNITLQEDSFANKILKTGRVVYG